MLAVVQQTHSGGRDWQNPVTASVMLSGLPVSTCSLDYNLLKGTNHASSGKHLWSACCVPGTVLSSEDSLPRPKEGRD